MEELELLESIYSDKWKKISDRIYSIEIISKRKCIEFQVIRYILNM